MNASSIQKKVEWRDLVRLSPIEKFIENSITIPWLLGSWIFAANSLYVLAIPCSFLFFLTALRQVHNGFHQSLGLGRRANWVSLYINSLLMLASAHAVQFNHLRHHKHCLGKEDYEGKCARMKWYEAILYGPRHIYSIHSVTMKLGNRVYKRNVLLEMISILILFSIAFLARVDFLVYHCTVMLIGEFFSAFFAVWTVHHDLDKNTIARTMRTGWKNRLTYNMFYHMEHHLFPAVPTIKLPELARRIDQSFPELRKEKVF